MMNWIEFNHKERHKLPKNTISTGTLIKDGAGAINLVGDINELGGICDCCNLFTKIYWEPPFYYCNDIRDKILELVPYEYNSY